MPTDHHHKKNERDMGQNARKGVRTEDTPLEATGSRRGGKGLIYTFGALMIVALLILVGAGIYLLTQYPDSTPVATTGISRFTSGSDRVTVEAALSSSEVYMRMPRDARVVSARVNATGTLHNELNYIPVGKAPLRSCPGDLDGDGDMDIATVNYDYNSVTVLLNRGDGRNFNSVNLSVSPDPVSIAIGDINGDGAPDIITISESDLCDLYLNFRGSGVFTDRITLSTGPMPTDVTAADLNGDGLDEVLALSRNMGGRIRIWWNEEGSFSQYTDVSTEGSPVRIRAMDMDMDGQCDIVTVNRGDADSMLNGKPYYQTSSVFLLENISMGGMELDAGPLVREKWDYPIAMKPFGLGLADLNDDGFRDIFTSGYGASSDLRGGVTILLNDGTGHFPGIHTESVSGVDTEVIGGSTYYCTKPDDISSGDLDGDGDIDLITTSRNSDSAIKLFNSGNGTFEVQPQDFIGFGPVDVKCADLDGDGDLDVFTTNGRPYNNSAYGVGSVSIMFNYGYGVFKWDKEFKVGSTPRGIDSSDLDNDGDLDIAAANYFGSTMSVIMNDGSGNYGSKRDYMIGLEPYAVCMADFDQDGYIDIASADEARFVIIPKFNRGDGTFTTDLPYHYDIGGYPFALRTADLNADGYPDLVTANHGQGTLTLIINQGAGAPRDQIFGNYEGPNKFISIDLMGRMPFDVAIDDINGDGNVDLVTANMGSDGEPQSTLSVLLYDKSINGYKEFTDYDVGLGPSTVVLRDYDGDGDKDIACVNSKSDSISFLFNDGKGKFSGRVDYPVGARPFFLAAVDIDKDSDLDIITTNSYSNSMNMFINDGSGRFDPVQERTLGAYPYMMTIGDFNKDGTMDMANTNVNAASVTVCDSLYYPKDVTIQVPNRNGDSFAMDGVFSQTIQLDLRDQINDYLELHASDAARFIDVPIIIRSSTMGLVTLSDLDIEYR